MPPNPANAQTISATLAAMMHDVCDITGLSYDRDRGGPPERHQRHRRLTVTAIPGAYEKPSHVAIAISGTPCRGLVIVDLEYENVPALDFWSGRSLTGHKTKLLRNFALMVRALIPNPDSNTWSWSSAPLKTGATTAPNIQTA